VFFDEPGLGTGAGTFAVARLRYRKTEQVSRHAHGFAAQTLADTACSGAPPRLRCWSPGSSRRLAAWSCFRAPLEPSRALRDPRAATVPRSPR
jgi:hypothetical protein